MRLDSRGSGIGEATARLLAHKGLQVVLGARRTDRLEAITSEIRAQGGSAAYRALDVTSLEEMQAFVDFANGLAVDEKHEPSYK